MADKKIREAGKGERREKSKSNGGLIAIILILFCVLCFAGGALAAAVIFMPSFTVDPYYKYVERGQPGELSIVYGDKALTEEYYALAFEDDVLIDLDFVTDYNIDSGMFWDSEESVLTVTTPLKLIRMKPEEAFYTLNGDKRGFSVGNTALLEKDGKVFVPASFLEEYYQIDYSISGEMRILSVDSRLKPQTAAAVKSSSAALRYKPDIKSDIAEKAQKNSKLRLFGQEIDGFYRARTENGALGYIKASALKDISHIEAETPNTDMAPPLSKFAGRRINIVWEQIVGDGGEGGQWIYDKPEGIDVVSPTWLSLSSGEGDIKDVGGAGYVDRAMSAGCEVWPLFSNSFDADITNEALKSTKKRERIIGELIGILEEYGVGGVNVDFESYRIEDGYYYTQFLKELCVSLRNKGLVSSVDLPVPTLQNSPTDREQIGKFADYVIVMAYDQHWASSQTKGPVAGYDWVYQGMERTLAYVPPEKVVLGLPLYTRIWYAPVDTNSITSRDFAMERAYDLFELRNAEKVWEENTKYFRGQYEYDVDGVRNVITAWLETVETLSHKAGIVDELDLAGVACWKKGLEAQGVWEMLSKVLRN